MMQLIQISQIVPSCSGLADQGKVLEGVADKPFLYTSYSLILRFFCNCKVRLIKSLFKIPLIPLFSKWDVFPSLTKRVRGDFMWRLNV
jgi:hypothetical protein